MQRRMHKVFLLSLSIISTRSHRPFHVCTLALASFPGLPPLFCITGFTLAPRPVIQKSGGKPGNEANLAFHEDDSGMKEQ